VISLQERQRMLWHLRPTAVENQRMARLGISTISVGEVLAG
jgi:hypothetical protein